MAEMTTLVAAVYRKYSTSVKSGYEDVAPGVTSRFEVFHDDTFDHVSVRLQHTVVLTIKLTLQSGT
jgi:hypothetical protein